ncbi:MAG: RnfABCDGE type electron transport complex subunit G, partial [Bacteroidaceae bacterium]|nr:RnfABCDGE type electron transport complex subunit G [Bacteroidaceae bacterium]
MKKLESSLLNMTVVLTVISVIAGGLLAYVNGVTEGPIREIKEKALADGIKSVLQADDAIVQQIDTIDGGISIVYKTDKGTAVQAVNNNAFGGAIKVLVGFDAEGSILGYSVLEHAETPGLGAKAGEWFQQGAKGNIIGMHPAKNNLTVSKDGGEVDAITASTITSRAFLGAVNDAYKAYQGESVDASSGATQQVNN